MATRVEEVELNNGRTLVTEFYVTGVNTDKGFEPRDVRCSVYTIGPRGGRKYEALHVRPGGLRATAQRYFTLAHAAEKRWREVVEEARARGIEVKR